MLVDGPDSRGHGARKAAIDGCKAEPFIDDGGKVGEVVSKGGGEFFRGKGGGDYGFR